MDKIPEEAHTTSIHAPSANIRGTLYSLHLMSSKSKPTEVISQSTNQSHLKNPENTVAEFAEAHTYSIHAPSANVRAALFIL